MTYFLLIAYLKMTYFLLFLRIYDVIKIIMMTYFSLIAYLKMTYFLLFSRIYDVIKIIMMKYFLLIAYLKMTYLCMFYNVIFTNPTIKIIRIIPPFNKMFIFIFSNNFIYNIYSRIIFVFVILFRKKYLLLFHHLNL